MYFRATVKFQNVYFHSSRCRTKDEAAHILSEIKRFLIHSDGFIEQSVSDDEWVHEDDYETAIYLRRMRNSEESIFTE